MAPERITTSKSAKRMIGFSPAVVLAMGAVVVSLVALAFSVGRHFPISAATDLNQAGAPTGDLETIRQTAAIAYDQLEVDRGVAATSTYSATRQARRGDSDDD